ncbi:hypothetical protein, partial [Nocardiopsis alkaliphila]|uniref:hypothetical protein n=1 Tax=Nocardiopsis alkaliphila TaxID=225762 RepID=UPI0004768CCA
MRKHHAAKRTPWVRGGLAAAAGFGLVLSGAHVLSSPAEVELSSADEATTERVDNPYVGADVYVNP